MIEEEPAGGLVLEFDVPDRLRKAREYLGCDQTQFAELTGISRRTIGNYEDPAYAAKRKPYILSTWALATGVSRDWLETGEGVVPNPPSGRQEARGPTERLEELRRRNLAKGRGRRPETDTDGETRKYDDPIAA